MQGTITAPEGLSDAAKANWEQILGDYGLDDAAGLTILTEALRAYDRAEQARAVVDREGMTVLDKNGNPKQHPAVVIERDSRAAMLTALKMLRFDFDSDGSHKPHGRPWGASQ